MYSKNRYKRTTHTCMRMLYIIIRRAIHRQYI